MRIRAKILLIGLIIPLMALLALTVGAWYYLRGQALNAVAAGTHIGLDAARTSETELLRFTDYFLQNIARYRAGYCEQQLARVTDAAHLLTEIAKDYYAYYAVNPPLKPPPTAADLKYIQENKLDICKLPDAKVTAADENVFYELSEILVAIRDLPLSCNAYIASVSGIMHAAHRVAHPFAADYDFRERLWFREAVQYGAAGWSAIYRSANNNDEVITYYAPIFHPSAHERKLVAVIGVDLSIAALAKSLTDQPLADNAYLALLDKDQREIVRVYNRQEGKRVVIVDEKLRNWRAQPAMQTAIMALQREESGVTATTVDGMEYAVAYTPIPLVEWDLCIVVPREILLQAPQAVGRQIAAGGAEISRQLQEETIRDFLPYLAMVFVAAALMMVISAVMTRRITEAIKTLSHGTAQISRGDFAVQITVKTRDELQFLARDFNAMAAQLSAHTARLITAERMENEMRTAGDIQREMLPRIFPPFPEHREFSLYALMESAREVGGDLYDFFLIGENQICILVGDVSGKGVPAALFMTKSKALLRLLLSSGIGLAAAITRFNRIIADDNYSSYFLTLFVAVIDYQTGALEYVDAGHNPPFYMPTAADGYVKLSTTVVKNPAIGMTDDWEYRCGALKLVRGARLFIYSDGVTEAQNMQYKNFGEAALNAALNDDNDLPLSSLCQHLLERLRCFAGGQPAADDVTMLIFELSNEG